MFRVFSNQNGKVTDFPADSGIPSNITHSNFAAANFISSFFIFQEDLPLYSTFHSWIFPKGKFCAEKFKAKAHDLRDVIAKTVMLDAFLEDTVLRRTNFNTPFISTQVYCQPRYKYC